MGTQKVLQLITEIYGNERVLNDCCLSICKVIVDTLYRFGKNETETILRSWKSRRKSIAEVL